MDKPRYKLGQVVVLKTVSKEPLFRIIGFKQEDGMWFYQQNRNNFFSESMLRELNYTEKGEDIPIKEA